MYQYLKAFLEFIWEVVKVAVVSLAIILPIRYFLVQPFYVKGASMEPNFTDHDYLLIDEISYRFRAPERGEVVVFRYPKNPRDFYIKRVIGLPGERVVVRDTKVLVGKGDELKELAENYLDVNYIGGQINTNYLDVTLGADQYYVLGDNRRASSDSRSFGPITKRDLIGRSWVRAWPFNRWKVFGSASNIVNN
ncbi:MAG: signal peptidase I [Patescibacteria group bacterium]